MVIDKKEYKPAAKWANNYYKKIALEFPGLFF